MKNVCWQLPNVHIIVFKKKSKLESSSRVDIIKHQRLPKELDRKGKFTDFAVISVLIPYKLGVVPSYFGCWLFRSLCRAYNKIS